jgi:hypothetical protein
LRAPVTQGRVTGSCLQPLLDAAMARCTAPGFIGSLF